MHIKKLKLHTCGCISRCCGCNHRTGGNQWCTQYRCQYVSQENCAFHTSQWKRKVKPKRRPLIEEQREEQAKVLEQLKKRWAAEDAEKLQRSKYEQEAHASFGHPHPNVGVNSNYHTEPESYYVNPDYDNGNPMFTDLQQNLQSGYQNNFSSQGQNFQHPQYQHQLGLINHCYSNNNNSNNYSNVNLNRGYSEIDFQQLEQNVNNPLPACGQSSNTRNAVQSNAPIFINPYQNQQRQSGTRSLTNVITNANNSMAFPSRDPQTLDCFTQHKLHMQQLPDPAACYNDTPTTYGQDICHVGARMPPTIADCYGVHQAAGYGVQRAGYGVQPTSCDGYQPGNSGYGGGEQGAQQMMAYGDCTSDADAFQEESCPYAKPLSDIMEPRHYLYGSNDWKGVPLPFNHPGHELLLPSSHGTFQLLPSPNPFVYTGRKRRGPEDRFHGPEQPMPLSAKRPEVFGNEYGIEQTTNHLGYRAQRRHYKERPSFILFN